MTCERVCSRTRETSSVLKGCHRVLYRGNLKSVACREWLKHFNARFRAAFLSFSSLFFSFPRAARSFEDGGNFVHEMQRKQRVTLFEDGSSLWPVSCSLISRVSILACQSGGQLLDARYLRNVYLYTSS